MERFLEQYGLLAVLVGAAVEYDGTLVVAGVLVHLGLLGFATAVVAGGIGAVVGDSVVFFFARRGSARLRGSSAYLRVAGFVERLASRIGPSELVLARFVYGTRIASVVFWGLRGLGWATFAPLDLVGALLGATVLVTIGFAFSQSADAALGEVARVEKRLLAGAVVAALVVWAARRVGRRVHDPRSVHASVRDEDGARER